MKKKKDDFDIFEELEEGTEPETKEEDLLPLDDALENFDVEPEAKSEPEPESAPEVQRSQPTSFAEDIAELSPDVPVNLVAVIGKTTVTVADLIKYRIGKVIDLGRAPGETVDLVANGRLIARGELVDMDGKLGVKIQKMVK